ncbi:MAG: hypothetical protein HOB84_05345 [Candidatus Marinimicrobia bacterium]|jgi:predicted GH43/DUF377 family glycosyl hydrolase|nr:hypothetical protein [Candidatus Neomarinimicrobiota bacterium]MBT4359535.1 hypothetical protein [Candidatus Neomarinimicrobiota bacterium]MBT4714177.1 hypothetical protein [Candidatus Neomarinimicrobiota bacterium]MBT4945567.1 hypothetical protein [Candidatus Neomarinimicrobiota bacterium]MBT5314149.1 hypothetical protein [Candidatus Neomarinimicrobiota bacterium]
MTKMSLISVIIAVILVPQLKAFEYLDNLNNPIFNGSQIWDDLAVINPTVLYEDGAYKMWFGGRNVGLQIQIGYATSQDGIVWDELSDPVLTVGSNGEFDSQDLKAICVLHDDNEYKMYYTATNSSAMPRLGLATSPDGITWTKYAQNPILELGEAGSWNESRSHNASVIKRNGLYYMWFSGRNSNFEIGMGLAYSSDGITWEEDQQNPVFMMSPNILWESYYPALPAVIEREDGSFLMAYMGFDGLYRQIGIAHSTDGIQWNRYPGNPIIPHGSVGSWNEETSSGPSIVIIERGFYRMWYAGNSIYSTSTTWSFGQGDIIFDPMGDINFDYSLNISDVIQLVSIILGIQEVNEYQLEIADLNLDEAVDITDLQIMINTILE